MFKKPNTVPTPDEFFDIALKECSSSEIKLLAVVINKTFRWGKLWDYISTSQFEEETNLSNRVVITGLRSLENGGWIQSAYICQQCGKIVEQIFAGEKVPGERNWKKTPSSKCSCGSMEMPKKCYAALIEGEDLINHLRCVYKHTNKAFNDAQPADLMKKIHKGYEKNSWGGYEKNSYTGNLLGNQEETKKESCDFPKDENHDKGKKVSKPLSSYRKRLKGKQLEAFELIADNLEKVSGKTLIEFVEQSPEAVIDAYKETIERDKKHFRYFSKVFFSHYQKKAKTVRKKEEDISKANERKEELLKKAKEAGL